MNDPTSSVLAPKNRVVGRSSPDCGPWESRRRRGIFPRPVRLWSSWMRCALPPSRPSSGCVQRLNSPLASALGFAGIDEATTLSRRLRSTFLDRGIAAVEVGCVLVGHVIGVRPPGSNG